MSMIRTILRYRRAIAVSGAVFLLAGTASSVRAADNEYILTALKHACISKLLETDTYDRKNCELNDVSDSRTTLPAADALRYCAMTRLLVMLDDHEARLTEQQVCDPTFSADSVHQDGSKILRDGELYFPGERKLSDGGQQMWFSSGQAAVYRDHINYFGSGDFKSATQWFYKSTVTFKIENSYFYPSARLALTPRGILFYENNVVAGAVDGSGVDFFYPNSNGARVLRMLYCPNDSRTTLGTTSGNILTDACTLQRLCGPVSNENICRRRDFYRNEPQLEALVAIKILADIPR